MADIVLYTNPMSRGRVARWMLEEVGVPYDVVYLTYGEAGMGGAEYRAINPMGKVPAIRHNGETVTETAAICAYLADAFPEAGLAPEPGHRGAFYRWLFFGAGCIDPAVIAKALDFQVPPEREAAAGFGSFQRTFDTLEAALSAGPYLAGDKFTAADLYVGAQLNWGMGFNIIEPRPVFKDYAGRLTARDAYKRASALDDAAMKASSAE
ncbi:glutathione S-transferase [Acuticoccus sediminis]|uniref:Glutathione S-transferase n=1 Tax=Acuticoccus sediminis TaxID=2184697 RepID=A0A8B2P4Y5_9HYPH|nr:glutathione S-transferase family protein [Acuticoccus sediminis]RAI04172.1 glutathione S-transferase [Acuticoccus sediminis]